MIIKTMEASFGNLENEQLELKPGLNVIEAPNEAGKSTWCAFLRTMLYGINTSQREKAGVIPDKKRFLPWGNYSMAGRMQLQWRGGDVTLTRSGSAGKPMGSCTAKLTGTAEKVSELCGKAPGEVILGVPESVFRRSAFISGTTMAVDKDAELEKRISALVASGSEEDESWLSASTALRAQRTKRRHNARVGRLPELEARLSEKEGALHRLEEENRRMGDWYARREDLENKQARLQAELKKHEGAEATAEYRKAIAARASREQAQTRRDALLAQSGGLTTERVEAARRAWTEYTAAAAAKDAGAGAVEQYRRAKTALESAEVRLQKAKEAVGGADEPGLSAAREALSAWEQAETAAQAARNAWEEQAAEAKADQNGKVRSGKGWAILLLVCGAAMLAAALALGGGTVSSLLMAAGGVLLALCGVLQLIAAGKKQRAAGEELARRAALLAAAAKNREEAERKEGEAQQRLLQALSSIGAETIPQRARGRLEEKEELLRMLTAAEGERQSALQLERGLAPALEAAQRVAEACAAAEQTLREALAVLKPGAEPAEAESLMEEKNALLLSLERAESELAAARRVEATVGEPPAEEPEPVEEPLMEREQVQRLLAETRQELAAAERELVLSQGELRHLGDPVVLATECAGLRAEMARCEAELEAVNLAMEVLDEANAELQTRFAPIVGEKAGALLAAMTGDAYRNVSFDREFRFSAAASDGSEREMEYLSCGTASQLYLAVRLAVCLLALPQEEPCPIVLDDALMSFDDERARAALKLLLELSKERQILLFTCQSREKRLLAELTEEA